MKQEKGLPDRQLIEKYEAGAINLREVIKKSLTVNNQKTEKDKKKK